MLDGRSASRYTSGCLGCHVWAASCWHPERSGKVPIQHNENVHTQVRDTSCRCNSPVRDRTCVEPTLWFPESTCALLKVRTCSFSAETGNRARAPACLRPLSQLQYTGDMLFHTPIPSATRLASLWRQLAIDMREFDDPSLQHHPAQLHLSPATNT